MAGSPPSYRRTSSTICAMYRPVRVVAPGPPSHLVAQPEAPRTNPTSVRGGRDFGGRLDNGGDHDEHRERVRKPKFVRKDRERNAETAVLQAPPPELPIDQALAGPARRAGHARRHHRPALPRSPARPQARSHLRPRGDRARPLHDVRLARGARGAGQATRRCDVGRRARRALSVHRRYRRPGAGTGALPSWSLLGGHRPRTPRPIRVRRQARRRRRPTAARGAPGVELDLAAELAAETLPLTMRDSRSSLSLRGGGYGSS